MFGTADFDSRKKRDPFVPIRIVTDSGDSFVVQNRRMLMVGVRDALVGIPTRYDQDICERTERVFYSSVVALEDLPPQVDRELENGNSLGTGD